MLRKSKQILGSSKHILGGSKQMLGSVRKFVLKTGQPPGSLEYIGEHEHVELKCTVIKYNEAQVKKEEDLKPEDLSAKMNEKLVNWINVTGLNDADGIARLGEEFNIHNLILEDIMNTEHLPKIEQLADSIFVIIKALDYNHQTNHIMQDQICFVLGKEYLISFSEKEVDAFHTVRDRIMEGLGKARLRKADYLFTLLIDKIIDHYYLILGQLEQQIEEIETAMTEDPSESRAEVLLALKKQLILFKRYTDPLKEEIRKIIKEETRLISKVTIQYLKDVNDHVNHLIQSSENFKENVSGLIELNSSNMANKMNSVMMTLTIIATIFIPLTFIAGIYGMNFQNMPELEWKYGYPAAMIFMLVLGVGMYVYMKKKKWF